MSLDVSLEIEVDTGGKEPHIIYLYDANITHNLGPIAEMVFLYGPLWRPEENGIDTASDLIDPLINGLHDLRRFGRDHFKDAAPKNGWGTYDGFMHFVENLLKACQEDPKAKFTVSR
jgi:hypothetical protein|tara:strand:+ start:1271 stop:1621 length:351 start_codon:yes stop_codon:yes gene_type:complete